MAENVDRLCVGPRSEMLDSPVSNLFSSYARGITLERGRTFWKTREVKSE
ncbi:hypothetical protein Tco_0632011, partial [Tanacetum coccineum]